MALRCPGAPPHRRPRGTPTAVGLAGGRTLPRSAAARQTVMPAPAGTTQDENGGPPRFTGETDCPLRCRSQSSPSATAPPPARRAATRCSSAPLPPPGHRSTTPPTTSARCRSARLSRLISRVAFHRKRDPLARLFSEGLGKDLADDDGRWLSHWAREGRGDGQGAGPGPGRHRAVPGMQRQARDGRECADRRASRPTVPGSASRWSRGSVSSSRAMGWRR